MGDYNTHKILFGEDCFHPGLNLTVRDGDKWLKAQPGDSLVLCRAQDSSIIPGIGKVIATQRLPFRDFPKAWLHYEHAPGARTHVGLVAAMRAAYGDNWDPDRAVVTAVFFEYYWYRAKLGKRRTA